MNYKFRFKCRVALCLFLFNSQPATGNCRCLAVQYDRLTSYKKMIWTEIKMCHFPTCLKNTKQPKQSVNLPGSVAQELSAAGGPVLLLRAFPLREEVGAEQSVEINQHHDVHHHQGDQKVPAVFQPGVVVEDVPGEVELCAQAEQDVGQDVDELVDVVEGGGLSARQLQHQPQV